MDASIAPAAPPEPPNPSEVAVAALGGATSTPYAYNPRRDATFRPKTIAGEAGVGQGGQPLDFASASHDLASLAEQSAVYATRAFGPGTQRAYHSAWTKYSSWCSKHGLDPFAGAAGPIPLYVTHLAETGRAVSSIRVALAAIATAYRLAGLALDLRDPRLAPVVEGITRTLGIRPRRQATPAVPAIMKAMLAQCGRDEMFRSALAARDRAMLLLGFGAALRRSELVALKFGDAQIVQGRGVQLLIRRSKTDQQGRGHEVAIWANPVEPNFCPLVALEKWLAFRKSGSDFVGSEIVGDPDDRPLFCAVTKGGKITGLRLSDKAVVRLVKELASAAGLDSTRFAGHSLRSGLATGAGDAGVGLPDVMRQTRHRSAQVALTYLRPADLWSHNATERIFK
jgi:integrase